MNSTFSPDLNPLKILLVDDQQDNLDFLALFLEMQGFLVTTAMTVQEALQSLTATQPDLLIADIMLSGTDGLSLMQQVRALSLETDRLILAIAVTAFGSAIDQQEILAAGFQKCMSKPIDLDLLLVTIRELLETKERSA